MPLNVSPYNIHLSKYHLHAWLLAAPHGAFISPIIQVLMPSSPMQYLRLLPSAQFTLKIVSQTVNNGRLVVEVNDREQIWALGPGSTKFVEPG